MGVFDAVGERIVLVELYPYDPDSAGVVTLRVADRDYSTLPSDSPASVHYDGFLVGGSYSRALIAPGVLRGGSVGLTGAFRIGNPSRDEIGVTGRKLDAWIGYRWQGRRYAVWLLEPGQAFSTRTQIMAGSLGDLATDGADFVLAIRDRQADLQQDIQTALYPGTGGAGGGADLKDRPRPIGLGLVREVPAPMSDTSALWLDAHYGRIKQVLSVKDKGASLPANLSSPPPSGDHYAGLSTGRVQLGAGPDGEVRISFRGDDGDSGSPYVSTHAEVFRRVAGTYGGIDDPDDMDVPSFAAAKAANGAEMGIWIGPDPRSVADVLDEIMNSFGGWWIFTPLDKLKIGRLEAPTAAYAIDCDLTIGAYDIVEGSLKRLPMDVPPWQVIGRYKRYYGPIDRSGLAGGVAEDVKADLAQEWRQVTVNAAATLTEFPYSRPLIVDLLVDAEADATTEATRLAQLHLPGRIMIEAEVGLQILEHELHSQVWIEHPEEGLEEGRALRLVSTDVDLLAGTVRAQFWG